MKLMVTRHIHATQRKNILLTVFLDQLINLDFLKGLQLLFCRGTNIFL